MVGEIGNLFLIFAIGLCVLQMIPAKAMNLQLTSLIFSTILISFLCLVYSHVISDFSVINVYENSHTLKPLIYKISGTWGNHEGSMLLLVVILSAYSLAFYLMSKHDKNFKNAVVNVQAVITLGFLLFIYFTSNPFEQLNPKPAQGLGLNPLLQDIGLALHPPILYVGYIGFTIAFSFAFAGLALNKIDKIWANHLTPWVTFSLAFLTLGIGLGSWWAYRELGWGGYWFWDPVENVSLMPWLTAVALFHCLLIAQKRQTLLVWTCLLALITFSLSLTGIFLVRSGILTSVHSFASDPHRGLYMLAFIATIVTSSLILFAVKSPQIKSTSQFEFISKETSILLNNLLLVIACMTVMLGTLYPIILQAIGANSVSVGAPYFNITVVPMLLPLLALAAIGPMLNWNKSKLSKIKIILILSLLLSIFVSVALYFTYNGKSLVSLAGIILSIWLISLSVTNYLTQSKKTNKIALNIYSRQISHIGLAILTLGIAISSGWQVEKEQVIKKDEYIEISGYKAQLQDVTIGAGKNYITRQAIFRLFYKENNELNNLKPEVRHYPVSKTNTTEAAIYYSLFSNIYIAIGDSDNNGAIATIIYYKPFVNLIWLGCFMMFLGSAVLVFKKRNKIIYPLD